MQIQAENTPIPYQNPFKYFAAHSNNGNSVSLLMESRSPHLVYGRQSIVVPNAALRITGKNDTFGLDALTETGEAILHAFDRDDFPYATDLRVTEREIRGRVPSQSDPNVEEHARIRQPNASYAIRTVLQKFPQLKDDQAGLYGAFAYDFARNFENFGNRFSEGGEPDFLLFLPSTVVYFDDIREQSTLKQFFFDGKNDGLDNRVLASSFEPLPFRKFEDMSLREYQDKVAFIVNEIRKGRLMQGVLSRNQGMALQKHPLDSYAALREVNPSPYSFYFSFGNENYLYGASPELHIKVTNGEVEIRPIAGTIRRGQTPMHDYQARIALMTDTKELREHTMLVDLARHEIYRLADASTVRVTDLFTVEEYPNLFHLVSGVRGQLQPDMDALDALLTTIPAGTLSGAPKVEAMRLIEKLENSRRDFYGGAMGYLSFNGNANTGITIRSVFVKDGMSFMRAGAGIVAHSVPEKEAHEIQLKSEKAMKVLQ